MDAVRGWFGEEVERAEGRGHGDEGHVRQRLPFPGDHLRRQPGAGDLRHGDHRRVRHLLFVEQFGCDAYFRHNRELLFDSTRHRIREEIAAAKAAEQEENT